MAIRGETSSPESHCVFVDTNLDTRLVIQIHNDDTVSDFRDKLCKEHKECYPNLGEVKISALKIKRRGRYYLLSDSMSISKGFDGISRNWYVYVDAVRVEKNELLTIMADKNKEIAVESVLVGEQSKDLAFEEVLETEKSTRKRKMKSSDDKKNEKELLAIMADKNKEVAVEPVLVDEQTKDLAFKEVLEAEKSTRKRKMKSSDDKKVEKKELLAIMAEKKKEVAVEPVLVDEQTKDLTFEEVLKTDVAEKSTRKRKTRSSDDKNVEKKELLAIMAEKKKVTVIESVLVDEPTKDPTFEEVLETEKSTRKRQKRSSDDRTSRKKSSVDINQSAIATTESRDVVDESHELCGKVQVEVVAPESSEKNNISINEKSHELCGKVQVEVVAPESGEQNDIIMGEKSHELCGKVQVEVVDPEIGEKNDIIMGENQQTSVADSPCQEKILTVNSGLVDGHTTGDEVNYVQSNQSLKESPEAELAMRKSNGSDESHKSCGEVPTEKLHDLSGAMKQVDLEKGEKTAESVKIDQEKSQLEATSGLTTSPATEKKKRRKKSSKDHIDQSSAATTTSREVVNDSEKVVGSTDRVDATSESFPHLRGEKLAVDAIQYENEMGDTFVGDVGSKEAALIEADKIQAENNLQVADLALTPQALVEKSKAMDHNGKFTYENRTHAHDIVKDNVETDVDEAKSVKSTKKRKSKQVAHDIVKDNVETDVDETKSVKSTKKRESKKAKTPAREDTQVASGAQNVELSNGEGPDNVIRNVLDSLQERNETQENLDKIGKKSSKKSKKKHSSKIVESQVLSVEVTNAALEETPVFNNPKDTVAAKKNSENDASGLKQSIEVADNAVDNSPPKEILKANVDMGDDFGSSMKKKDKKQDQVTGGAKSKKEKKSLDLHPGGSIDVSLSSIKPKETNGRVQPTSSGTSHSKSRVKNDTLEETTVAKNPKDTDAAKKITESDDASQLEKSTDVADNAEDKQIPKASTNMGDNFGSSIKKKDIVGGGKKQDQVTGGAKSKKEKKGNDLHPRGSVDVSLSSVKPKETNGRVQPASSGTSLLRSRVKNDRNVSKVNRSAATVKSTVNNRKEEVKKTSNSLNFFKNADKWESSEDEGSKTISHVSTKTPSDSSSDNDSDVTSMSRKQENNLARGTDMFTGSLQDILRNSKSYKKAKITASQSQPDDEELDWVPDSQAI